MKRAFLIIVFFSLVSLLMGLLHRPGFGGPVPTAVRWKPKPPVDLEFMYGKKYDR